MNSTWRVAVKRNDIDRRSSLGIQRQLEWLSERKIDKWSHSTRVDHSNSGMEYTWQTGDLHVEREMLRTRRRNRKYTRNRKGRSKILEIIRDRIQNGVWKDRIRSGVRKNRRWDRIRSGVRKDRRRRGYMRRNRIHWSRVGCTQNYSWC